MMARVYYNENDPKTAQWLRNLIAAGLLPDGHVDDRSIVDVEPADLDGFDQCHFFAGIGGWPYALQLAGWGDRPVWTGSCPCQSFSIAGRRLGFADHRDLWPEMRRLIQVCEPDLFFGEQVDDSPEWFDRTADDLEACDYAVGSCVVPACAVGAPHERSRLWFVADAISKRHAESWERRQDSGDCSADAFGEANRLVNAVRRNALPFLCGSHDGVSVAVGEVCMRGFGNAIVPQVAAEFIAAFMEAEQWGAL